MGDTIQPEKQTVQKCLSGRTYYVDFYQREYVWTQETVEILLNDIFDCFEQVYPEYEDTELKKDTLTNFPWYYLNVYITNNIGGKVYIVDGQQRLSTLTLICTKLVHKVDEAIKHSNTIENESEKTQIHNKMQNLKDLLLPCIFGSDNYEGNIYRIDNDKRKNAMNAVLNGEEFDLSKAKFQTEKTIIERYQNISDYLDNRITSIQKLTYFVHFFLEKLIIVELCIDKQEDTAMVFEVINDRGEALKPFEILKGKLIGIIPKSDTSEYSDIWDDSMRLINGKQDEFFFQFFRSRFTYNHTSETENRIMYFYHRFIFEDNEIAKKLQFRKSDGKNRIKNIKDFISNDVVYYSKLYSKIIRNNDINLFYCNKIFQLQGQYQLILAACEINDPDEDVKIKTIAREYDRLQMLLKLNSVYESQAFQNITFALAKKLRTAELANYRTLFNEEIINAIKEKKGLQIVNSVLEYSAFNQLSYLNMETKSLRYLLARTDDYISQEAKASRYDNVQNITTKGTAYHIEHIFSRNETNISYFANEEDFELRRNNIGALLILKGRNNESSGNEEYTDKLQTYSSGPVWGHTLCKEFYHANKDFEDFNTELENKTGINFKYYEDKFDTTSMEERCKLLYELAKLIWDVQ